MTPRDERNSVINHNRNCCDQPRERLNARSIPGRRIDQRYPPVDPFPPKPAVPRRLVQAGDIIQYYTGQSTDGEEIWLRATVRPMTKKLQLKHPDYYNILDERGQEKSIELLRGGAWCVLNTGDVGAHETSL